MTANPLQRITVAVNDADASTTLTMPFTVGEWGMSDPVTLTLGEGANTLRFWRDHPPQYGLAVKSFTLTPLP